MKFIKYIMLILVLLSIGCSNLYYIQRTECKMQNNPTLALLMVYESEIFTKDSPSGYKNSKIEDIINELTRLGFDITNINPLLNDEIEYIINSTIRHEKRVRLISTILKENYDYFLYINIRNSYITITNTDEFKVKLAIRFKLLDTKKAEDNNDSLIDEELLYDSSATQSEREYTRNMSKNDLKSKSLDVYQDFILNFINDFVRNVRNFEYTKEGKDPICLNLNYNSILI